jgi:hypothetical protein
MLLGHVQWGDVSLLLWLPRRIFAELEERETKKEKVAFPLRDDLL